MKAWAWAWCALLVPLFTPTTHAQDFDLNPEDLLAPPPQLLTRSGSINTPCQTSDNQQGVCGNALLCEQYVPLLSQVSTNTTVLTFFRGQVCRQAPGVVHVCCPIAPPPPPPPPQGPPPTPSSSISFIQPPRGSFGFHRPSQRPNARQPARGGFHEENKDEEEEEEKIKFVNPPVQPTRFPQIVTQPLHPSAANPRPHTRFPTTTTTTTTTTRPQQPPLSVGVFLSPDRGPIIPGGEDVPPVSQSPEPPITEPPVPAILPSENECGSTSQGGSATPWAVGVGVLNKDGFQVVCGGALISHLHVVVAAHCLHAPAPTHVRLGNLPGATEDSRILTWVHPNYNAARRDNDIALITLDASVSFSDNIRPVCLPFPYRLDGFVGQQMQVLGWGKEATVEEGTVQVIGLGDCRKAYHSPALISDNKVGFFSDPSPATTGFPAFSPRSSSGAIVVDRRHLCGSPAPSAPSSTTCLSDFGAPLIYLDLDTTGKHFLVGVSSRGEGCEAGPGLYTRVGSFLPWLATQLSSVKASTQSPASSLVPSPSLIRRVPELTHRNRG